MSRRVGPRHTTKLKVTKKSLVRSMGRVRSKDRSVCDNVVLKINNGQDVSEMKEAA